MSILSVRNLSKAFGGVHAVDDVSFDVGEGEFLALIGPNGAGKSTCFNMINGQLRPIAATSVWRTAASLACTRATSGAAGSAVPSRSRPLSGR